MLNLDDFCRGVLAENKSEVKHANTWPAAPPDLPVYSANDLLVRGHGVVFSDAPDPLCSEIDLESEAPF